MPKREASKCREWERERRERLKTCFDALAKLLPNHDPAIAPSKLEILQRAATYITDLQQKNKDLENDDPQVTVAQRDETRKLRDRVRRLSSRAEQLAGLLRAAGLKIPKECNGVVFKGPPRLWSGKVSREKAELLKKRHEEESKTSENAPNPSDKPTNKKKRKRAASPTKKPLTTLSENGLILGPVLKRLTLTTNSTTVKVLSSRITRRQNARLSTTTSGSTTSTGVAARVGAVLGPGTLILADGSVVPVPAPRAAPPATLHRIQLLPVTTASASPVILMQRNIATGNNDSNSRHPPIRPKTALCRASRSNLTAKIPIPTLRSSRAIISRKKVIQQRKIDQKPNKKVNAVKKKPVEPSKGPKIVAAKAKTASNNKITDSCPPVINKKTNEGIVEQNITTSTEVKNKAKNEENTDKDVLPNKENNRSNKVEDSTKNTKDGTNIEAVDVVTPVSTAKIISIQKDDKKSPKMTDDPEEKSSKTYTEPSKNIHPLTPSIEIVPIIPKMITPELKQDTAASDIEKELDNLSEKTKNSVPQQHCHQQILQETEEKILQDQNEPQQQQPQENNQMSELNHEEMQTHQPENHQDEHHSELSNDIFASLQDGTGAGVIGGQHTESMSPTAAFLLAFPLVSTLTGGGRVNDGPNTHGSTNGDGRIINGSSNGNASGNNGSDDDGGRQGTPTTLLQIGGTISMDNGGNSGNGQNKQRQIQLVTDEVPRSLDNFSFFTKEVQPYNTNRDHSVSTALEPIISHACLYDQQTAHVSNPTEPAALPNISYYTDASVAFSNNPFTELRPQTEHQSSNQQHHAGYSCLAKDKSGGKQRMNKNQQQQQQQQYRAPVNWMTSPDVRPTYTHQHYQHASTSSSFNTSDYFLPPFSDVYGNNSSLDHNLSAEHPPFTWSPTAGRSALPTLIGDLALGVTNSHNLEPSQQMEAPSKDNSGATAPFLSVSSLVNGNKQRKQSSSQQSTKRHREKPAKNRANNPNNTSTMPNNQNTHISTQSTPNNSIVTNPTLHPLVPAHNTGYSGANSSTNNLKRSDNQRQNINPNNTVNPFMDNLNNVVKRTENVSYLDNIKRSENNTLYTANNTINSGNQNTNNNGAIMNVNTNTKRNNDNSTYHLDNNMLKRTDHTSYADASVHNNSVNVKRTNNTSYIDNNVNTALKSIRNFLDNSVKRSDNSFIDNSVKRPDNSFIDNSVKRAAGSNANTYLDNSVKRADNSFIDNTIKRTENYLDNTIKRSENYLDNTIKRNDNSYLDTSASNIKRSLVGGYSAEALIASNNSTIQQQNNHHQMYSAYDQRSSSYTLPPGGVIGSNNCTIEPNTQHHHNQNQHHYQQQIPHQQQIHPPHQQHRNNVHPFHANQNTRHPINSHQPNNNNSVGNNQHQNNQHINITPSIPSSVSSAPPFGHMPSAVVTTASIATSYVAAPPLGGPPREFSALLSAAVVDTYSKPFDSFVHVKPPVPVPPPPLAATTLTMTTATTSISTSGSYDSYCGINTNNTHSSRPHMGSSDNTDRRRHSSRRNNNTSNPNNNINSTSTTGPFAELNFLSMSGSVNSPLLQDDFHTAPFLSNGLPVPPVPPPMPPTGSSLTNFNVSAIFPEINKATGSLPVTTWPATKSSSSSRSHGRYHQHNQIMHSHNHHPQNHIQHQQQQRNNSDHTGQTNSSGYRQHGHQNQHSTHQQFTPDSMYSVANHSSAANSNIMPHHQVQPFPSSTSSTLPTGAPDVPSAAPSSTFSFSFTTP